MNPTSADGTDSIQKLAMADFYDIIMYYMDVCTVRTLFLTSSNILIRIICEARLFQPILHH